MLKKNMIYSECYGCASNKSDYEIIQGILINQGYIFTDKQDKGDVLILNTCGVKEVTENRMLHRIHQLYLTGKPLIISGCLPKINLKKIIEFAPNFAAVLDPYSLDKITFAVNSALNGETGRKYFRDHAIVKSKFPRLRSNRYIAIVQISEGCKGSCSYCCTRLARGSLTSFPIEEVLKSIEKSLLEGVREIQLTAQDTGAYGLDIGCSIVDLLKKILVIRGKYKVRLGMMSPEFAFNNISELLKIYKNHKMFKFIHLPVQSGSNEILNHMKRSYAIKEFECIVKKFRDMRKDFSIATDIIVGYPMESENDFKKTQIIIKKTKPDIVNISKYGLRPGTAVHHLGLLPPEIISRRSRLLSKECSRISYERNLLMVRRNFNVFFNEFNGQNTYLGRSDNYKKILLNTSDNLLGSLKNVLVNNCTDRYLIGVKM